MSRQVPSCPECTVPGGWCAPERCYCGHRSCPAYHSYVSRAQLKPADANFTTAQHAQSWAQREEATWLDKL